MTKLLLEIEKLFQEQYHSWPLLKNNVDALGNVEINKLYFDENVIEVHHNPERIKSTSAKVDSKSIEQRPCFLCDVNRPIEQKNILVFKRWKILCNPYPILKKHLTIVRSEHIPQLIWDSFDDMLDLAKELKDEFTLFYNGPKHGASAPDHLHFQAVPSNNLPLEKYLNNTLLDNSKRFVEYKVEPQKFNFYLGSIKNEVVLAFRNIYKSLEEKQKCNGEPGLNILVKYMVDKWQIVVFERTKHRPTCFNLPEPDRMMISPASVDLAGIMVVPRKEDFVRVTKELVKDIYSEIC